MNAGAVVERSSSAVGFSPNQAEIDLIRETVCPRGISEAQFRLFVAIARNLGLNPLKRQIYALPFKERADSDNEPRLIVHVGIEGYRSAAARRGTYQGTCNERLLVKTADGTLCTVPHAEYDPETHIRIVSATVGVRHADFPAPVEGTALFQSYAQFYNGKPSRAWARMPDVLLLKCAEALAHRKASPDTFEGTYVTEEVMGLMAAEDGPTVGAPVLKKLPGQRKKKDVEDTRSVGEIWLDVEQFIRAKNPDPNAVNESLAMLEEHFGMGIEEIPPEMRGEMLDYCRGEFLKALRTNGIIPNNGGVR